MKYSTIIIENGITGQRNIIPVENYSIKVQYAMIEDVMEKHLKDRVPFYVTYAYD